MLRAERIAATAFLIYVLRHAYLHS
jgi:hypothetical protein